MLVSQCCCGGGTELGTLSLCEPFPNVNIPVFELGFAPATPCYDERYKAFFLDSVVGSTWTFSREERDGDGITGTAVFTEFGAMVGPLQPLRLDSMVWYLNGSLVVSISRRANPSTPPFSYNVLTYGCGAAVAFTLTAVLSIRSPLASELESLTWDVDVSGYAATGSCSVCGNFNDTYVFDPSLVDVFTELDKLAVTWGRGTAGTSPGIIGSGSMSNCVTVSVGTVQPAVSCPTPGGIVAVPLDGSVHPRDPLNWSPSPGTLQNNGCGTGSNAATVAFAES